MRCEGRSSELGEFHNPDRLVICHGTGYFKMAAHQFDLILHLLEHNNPVTSPFSLSFPFVRLLMKPLPWSPGILSGN